MTLQNTPFKRYIVDVYGGQYATIRDEGSIDTPSEYLNTPAEIDAVSKAIAANSTFIQSNLSEIDNKTKNQIRYVEMIGSNLADDILVDAEMVFDPDPRYAYDGVTSPQQALQSGNCTYILEHVQYPALYKIGFTSNLYKRTEKLYQENNKLPVRLIAFFKTDQNIALETYLHMAFASYRKTGEWFMQQPIERWINFYKAGLAVKEEIKEELVEPYVW